MCEQQTTPGEQAAAQRPAVEQKVAPVAGGVALDQDFVVDWPFGD